MNNTNDQFELCGETFSKKHMPNLYRVAAHDLKNAEAQLQSIAAAWHNGSIVSAAQALESDLAHG